MSASAALPWIGGALAAVAAFPQVYKCRRADTTRDLHFGTMGLRILGSAAMIVYGALRRTWAFVIVNVTIVCSEFFLVAAKVRDECKSRRAGEG